MWKPELCSVKSQGQNCAKKSNQFSMFENLIKLRKLRFALFLIAEYILSLSSDWVLSGRSGNFSQIQRIYIFRKQKGLFHRL